jgi:hypothetical protein
MRITSSGYSYGRKPKIKLTPAARREMAAQGVTPEQLAANNAAHHAAERAGTLRPKWSAPRDNNVQGNSRQGSSYRTGYDDAGNELHLYAAEAGGIPREVVKVGSTGRPKATMASYRLPPGPRGDSPSRGRNEGGRDQDMRDSVAPNGRYANGNPIRRPAKKRRRSSDAWIG